MQVICEVKRELGNTGISDITELENHNNSLAIIKIQELTWKRTKQ